jgi:hypothetical protein
MNFYNPTNGEVDTTPVNYRPRTSFLLTQLGGNKSPELLRMRQSIDEMLSARSISIIDAGSVTTGKDFLLKIWKLIYAVPMVIAVVERYTPIGTLQNIFYELGVAQAMGKETLVIVGDKADMPSDLVRTEYISFGKQFAQQFSQFLDDYEALAGYYDTVSEQLDRNPVLAIDYLRRSYLISGEISAREKARGLLQGANADDRAKNSVEALLANF